jgi:hypothetical protein
MVAARSLPPCLGATEHYRRTGLKRLVCCTPRIYDLSNTITKGTVDMCKMCYGFALDHEPVFDSEFLQSGNVIFSRDEAPCDVAPGRKRRQYFRCMHCTCGMVAASHNFGYRHGCSLHVPVPVRSHNLRTSVRKVMESQLSPLRQRGRTMNQKSRKYTEYRRDTTTAVLRLSPGPTF